MLFMRRDFNSRMMLLEVLVVTVCTRAVVGYGTGPPDGACNSMAPLTSSYGHGANPQTGSSPFSVALSKTTYSSGEQIQVTIQGSSSFKGFLIQPRRLKDTYETYGQFDQPSGSRNPCNGNTALSHSSKAAKNNFVITWTAPTDYQGDIVFVFTVVQSKAVYWVKMVSQTLTYQASTQPTQDPGQTTTQATTTDQSTQGQTGPAPTSIERDPGCGVTHGCYPTTCTTDCDYLIMWRDLGNDIEFTMMKKTTMNSYYFAIGFSENPKMGDDSVQDCISNNGAVDTGSSYNHAAKYNEKLDQKEEGSLKCLRQQVREKEGRRVVIPPSLTWRMIGFTTRHTVSPVVTQRIDFQKVEQTIITTPEPGVAGALKKDSGCGESIGCFHNCKGDNCGFLLTWKENGDNVDLTLSCRQSGNVYCAIGLSDNKEMGDDSVFECVSDAGQVSSFVSYNGGRDNERLDDGTFGLSAQVGSHVDGILKCVFSRKKTSALASGSSRRRKRAAADASTFFNMDSDWYLLSAYGSSIGGFVSKHSTVPIVSSEKADFQKFQDISAEAIKNTLIRVHGILMVLAWMFSATIGIYMARFYKDVWPEGMEWFGDKRWFVLHRGLMINSFIMTVVAVILIFVHVEGWAEISGSGFDKSHPIIGIVVTAFVFINPIMAFFRPHPGTRWRPLFKSAHTFVGVAAYVLGIVNIFSGTGLTAANMPDYIRYILYTFCGWIFVMDMVLHIYNCSKSSAKKGEAYEMKPHASEDIGSSPKVDSVKVIVLVLHALVVIGLAVAVAIVIGTANKDGDDI